MMGAFFPKSEIRNPKSAIVSPRTVFRLPSASLPRFIDIPIFSGDLHERIGGRMISVGGFAANSGWMLKEKASYADISMGMEKADRFLKANDFRVMTPVE
jgi:hypothetical protein